MQRMKHQAHPRLVLKAKFVFELLWGIMLYVLCPLTYRFVNIELINLILGEVNND